MKVLKAIGWYFYAVLVTILTLGGFLRFHLITVRRRTLGGVRAGTFGGIQIFRDADKFLTVSRWRGKQRYPLNQISYAETGILSVGVDTSGSRPRKGNKFATWQTRTVADFINRQIEVPAAR